MRITAIPSGPPALIILLMILFASPLAGVMLAGGDPGPYLEFPPVTLYVEHPGFSWTAFLPIMGFIAVTTWPFWRRLFSRPPAPPFRVRKEYRFPWWGCVATAALALFWVLAWTRFSWFEPYQRHTYFPLWLSFILLLNAVAFRICGRCLMLDRTTLFVLLFPASASFWWIFEYLNRFVNNWYYTGTGELESLDYFLEASLAFSTVLPAVMSVRYILLQFPVFRYGYTGFPKMEWLQSRRLWMAAGAAAVAGLAGTGRLPEFTYPLIWMAPGLLWIASQMARGYVNPLAARASRGDLTLVWASAVAALVCGFFWEMWNFYSEAKWIYNIPGVERFHIFEMPLPGYAGYLPFGVICAVISNSLLNTLHGTEDLTEEGEDHDSPVSSGSDSGALSS